MTSDRIISRDVISFHCKQPLSNKNKKFAIDDDSSLVKRRYIDIEAYVEDNCLNLRQLRV